MSSIWDRFDNIASTEEVEEAKKKFSPIDAGEYECVLEEIKASESQSGLPMIKGKFRIIEGNRTLYYNQVLQNINDPKLTASNIADAVNFVGNLINTDIVFEGLGKFAEVVDSIVVGGVYKITVSYGKKDLDMKYPKLKVSGVVSLPDTSDVPF